uniref:C-type lectin domain-containing protein n=1 Tax=Panagrolaimus davidi TaxID=227884 RepID=A0A914QNQ4_9BILA
MTVPNNIFVNSHAHTIFTDSSDFWIGANNFAISDAVWSWIDSSALVYEEWDKYEFQNTSSSLCGAGALHKSKWITTSCLNNKPFVCMLRNPDWTYFKGTGYYYKIFNISTTWENAEKICVQANSHLISIHSSEELTFATEFVSPFSTNACLWRAQTWIGMFTINNNQNWLWTDGTAFDYSKWAPYEPDNPGGQNCGNIWTGKICDHWQNKMFYNHGCSIPMNNFICKKGH